ncbi:MAG TPA: hypothetical protein VN442_22215 [Bryobacteraceae bacterium]|nr:hypothetical protein [Bryobacteraceae bacterium]
MNPEEKNQFGRWSTEELQKAETTATRFLEDNGAQIAETLDAKVRFLEILIERLSSKKTTLDQRLDCFARIAEISDLLKEDADGFFELASRPMVARILTTVRTK